MDNNLEHIDKLITGKLQSHAVESTVDSWAVISKKLFWRNFMFFRFDSFNVYYLSAILVSSVWLASYLINPVSENITQSNLKSFDKPSIEYSSENTPKPEVTSVEKEIENSELLDNKTSITELSSATTGSENNEEIVVNTELSSVSNINSTIESSTLKKTSEIITSDRLDINTNNLSNVKGASATSKAKVVIAESEIHYENIDSKISINEKSSAEVSIPENSINEDRLADNSVLENDAVESINVTGLSSEEIVLKSELWGKMNYITPLGFDNSLLYGSNSSGVIKFSDDIDFYTPPGERTSWALEGYFSPLLTNNITTTNNSEINPYLQKKTSIEKTALSFSTGINLIYHGKHNMLFQTGVAYTELGERIKRNDILDVENYTTPRYPDGGFFNTDTVLFVNIDSLNQGIHYVDTLFETQWVIDNSLINVSDSTIYKGANIRNKYSYIEIPLMIGYNFPGPGFELQFKTGIITGYWIKTNGFKANPDNEMELVDINSDSPKFRKMNYSFAAGVNMNYYLNNRISVSTGLMYRKNLTDTFESYLYNQRHFGTEFRVGIQYHL